MNKVIPDVRFNNFNDNWNDIPLNSLMSFSNGINADKENYGHGRKMISVMDILANEPLRYSKIRNSVKVNEKIEINNKVEYGDLVFVRSSEVIEEVGWSKAYLENKYALFSGFTIRGKKIQEFNAHFFELSLNEKNRKQVERKSGGSTRYNISQSILKSLVVPSPGLTEQNQISSFFKQIDVIIELNQHALDLLKQRKKAFLQKMFPKKGESVPDFRFSDFTKDWEINNLGEITTKNTKKNKKIFYSKVESISNKYGFISQSDQFDRSIASLNTSNYYIIYPKMFAYNPSRINVGSLAYKSENSEVSIVSPLYVSFSTINSINDLFLLYWFSTQEFERQRVVYSEGSVRDTLSYESLSEINIKVPTLEEQTKIGIFFKELDDSITLQEEKLVSLKQMKKAFSQKMFV